MSTIHNAGSSRKSIVDTGVGNKPMGLLPPRFMFGHRHRIVRKNGALNTITKRISKQKRRYFRDIFTTLLELKWRWTILIFALGFICTWVGFAIVWYIISYVHGDFDHIGDKNWKPCILEQYSFASSYLFSLETQHTIGYGARMVTEECAIGAIVLTIQSITGVLVQCIVIGMVFSKVVRPKKRAQTLLFSRNACVSIVDEQLSLQFRVGDMRRTEIIEAHIRAILLQKVKTPEGEVIPLNQYELDVGFGSGSDRLLLCWPMTICHIINETSPFYKMTAIDFSEQIFEVIVVLAGINETTGQTVQARTSYLNDEIYWGHRFTSLVTFEKEKGVYEIDFSCFHKLITTETPECSGEELQADKGDQTEPMSPAPSVQGPWPEYTSKNGDKSFQSAAIQQMGKQLSKSYSPLTKIKSATNGNCSPTLKCAKTHSSGTFLIDSLPKNGSQQKPLKAEWIHAKHETGQPNGKGDEIVMV